MKGQRPFPPPRRARVGYAREDVDGFLQRLDRGVVGVREVETVRFVNRRWLAYDVAASMPISMPVSTPWSSGCSRSVRCPAVGSATAADPARSYCSNRSRAAASVARRANCSACSGVSRRRTLRGSAPYSMNTAAGGSDTTRSSST